MHKYQEAAGIEEQLQLNSRRTAIQRWTDNRSNPSKKQKGKPLKA
jgi:hypothetical protein